MSFAVNGGGTRRNDNDNLRDYHHRRPVTVQVVRDPSAEGPQVPYRMAPAQQQLQPDGFISVTSRKYR